MPQSVIARVVQAANSSTSAAIGSVDKASHDELNVLIAELFFTERRPDHDRLRLNPLPYQSWSNSMFDRVSHV